MTPTDLIRVAVECLAACGAEPPPKAHHNVKRQYGDDVVYESGLWSVTVPGARPVVPLVMAYAADPHVTISVGGLAAVKAGIQSARPASDGVQVEYSYQLAGGPFTTHTVTVPYPHDLCRQLFSGNWTRMGQAEFRFNPDRNGVMELMPRVDRLSDGNAVLGFHVPVDVRWKGIGKLGLFRRVTQTRIHSLVVSESEGRFRTNSMFNGLFPTLIWK